ncbi:MAG: DUF4262 domain-containing protein [Rhizobiaceae bacterium]|nr:DUF4262 domain-containing protein [Rhizobiaceae bacterium]
MSEYNDYERKLIDNIDKHGWHFTYVFDPDGDDPDFGYSVGFTKSLGSPEFIVFGLSQELMHHMIWEAFRQIEKGVQPADDLLWNGILDGFSCVSKRVQKDLAFKKYLVSASWFWEQSGNSGNPEVYQLVWPSAANGLFPWDDECDQAIIDAQPQLW